MVILGKTVGECFPPFLFMLLIWGEMSAVLTYGPVGMVFSIETHISRFVFQNFSLFIFWKGEKWWTLCSPGAVMERHLLDKNCVLLHHKSPEGAL